MSQPRPDALTLVSHHLCPFVQRAIIVALEKGVAHERIYIDLANKPDWFLAISPTGKVPVLRVGERAVLFESVVIGEYLDETTPPHRLHPEDALERARHRAWIEYGSGLLGDLYLMTAAPDQATYRAKRDALAPKLELLERTITGSPWFAPARFHLVDAMYAPLFRYFEAIDGYLDHGLFDRCPKLAAWRAALAARPSVRDAAPADYVERYLAAQRTRGTWLAQRILASPRR